MRLLTLALGALGLASLSVSQELGSTTILTTIPCVGNYPGQTTVTQPPPQIAVSTTMHHNTTTTKFPKCTYIAGEYVCPTLAVQLRGAGYPHDVTTTIIMASPTTSCPSGITLMTGEGTHVQCNTTSVAPTVSRICTTTYARWVDCNLTAIPAPCPPGACGPACHPDAHCRKDVKYGREASPSSQDLGGRSQRRVARETSVTFPRPCDHSGGDCFTGTPAKPTQDFSILPISMPASAEMHTVEASKSMDVSILLTSMPTSVDMHTMVTVTRRG